MTKTTLLKRRAAMVREPLPQCHGGAGALDWTTVLGGEELRGRHLNYIHDDILPPGASIGVHRHEHDEEYYYFVAGRGVMTLGVDGERCDVQAGDITAVYPGGEHGLENNSNADLRVIVICVS
jgi:uncharacterized cupin superfamily protein